MMALAVHSYIALNAVYLLVSRFRDFIEIKIILIMMTMKAVQVITGVCFGRI